MSDSDATTFATISSSGLVRFQFDGILRAQAGSEIPAETIAGLLSNEQIAELEAAKLTGTISEVQIADGAVSTPKLAAGAVVTATLAAGAVTAEKMTVAELSAIAGNLGTITAGTVTGATIRTAAAGARIVMDGAGLRAYNAGAEEVLSFSTASGNLSIKGEIKAGSSVPASTVTGQLTNAQLKEIEAAKLTGTISELQIGNEAISAPKLKAGAVVTAKLAAGAVTAEKMTVATLAAITAALGTVTSGLIRGTTFEAGSAGKEEVLLDTHGLTLKAGNAEANTISWSPSPSTHFTIGGMWMREVEFGKGLLDEGKVWSGNNRTNARLYLQAFVNGSPEGNFILVEGNEEKASVGNRIAARLGNDASELTLLQTGQKSSFPQLAEPAKRLIAAGQVSSAGAKVSGDGFKVERLSAGTYKITLLSEATIAPAATVTPITTTAIPVWTVGAISKSSIEVRIWNFGGGTAMDCAFSVDVYG